jgi:regulator of protease activity HflC (stomatin/prohibitin superfamily)
MWDSIGAFIVETAQQLRCWIAIEEFQRGVLLRWGKFHRELEPGLHWLVPLRDQVLVDNVVDRTTSLPAQSLVTKDGRQIVIGCAVTSSIRDIRKALVGVESVDHALVDSCAGTIAESVTSAAWDELATAEFREKVTKACRKNAWRYGIEIERVQLVDISISPSVRVWLAKS